MDLSYAMATLSLPRRRWRTALVVAVAAVLIFAITVADDFV